MKQFFAILKTLRFRIACQLARSLRSAKCGVAAIEFALILPLFIFVAWYGTELAYYAAVRLQISQIAISVADNAARLGQTDNSGVTPTLTEADIDSVMFGAMRQGDNIKLQTNGRVILSSLERDSLSGRQWIHWQRCRGNQKNASNYGVAGAGLSGTILPGVGRNRDLQAEAGSAVMIAEVFYNYTSLFGSMFPTFPPVREEAIFMIRDDRNLGDSKTAGISPGTSKSAC